MLFLGCILYRDYRRFLFAVLGKFSAGKPHIL